MTTSPLASLSTPIATLDPDEADSSDLAAFGALIGDARVVSVGESAHGVREFTRLKDRLFRYLVREQGFTAFALESGFPEGLAINDWILGGPGEIENIAPAGVCYSFDTEDLRDQFRWMRQWNATHDRKLHFYGFDVAGSASSPHAGVAACLDRLEPRPGDAELLNRAWLGHRFEVQHVYPTKPIEEREGLWSGIAELAARATAEGNEVALRCARSVEVLRTLIEDPKMERYGRGENPRDSFMAETVQWLLGREERIMISAHNAHIMRGDFIGAPMMGKLLAPTLGAEMVVVGTTYAQGKVVAVANMLDRANWAITLADLVPPSTDTLDGVMDAVPADLHLVDIRKAADADLATSMLLLDHVVPVDPRGFDALVHVRHVTPAMETYESISREVEFGRAAMRRLAEASGPA